MLILKLFNNSLFGICDISNFLFFIGKVINIFVLSIVPGNTPTNFNLGASDFDRDLINDNVAPLLAA